MKTINFEKIKKTFNNILSKEDDDSYEFLPIVAEIEEEPLNPLGRTTFWVIITLIFFTILWLTFGKVDIVVSARGKIIPDGEIKIIQPLETGVIKQILVKEGDFVRKGQTLMEIDTSTTQPQLESLKANLEYINLERKRLNAVLFVRHYGFMCPIIYNIFKNKIYGFICQTLWFYVSNYKRVRTYLKNKVG